ncbi:hypothetical protein AB0N08_13510 [Streptomyces nigra]
MTFGEDDMNASARLGGDLVCGVLDQFEELAVAVASLSDTALPVRVFGHEAGVHGIRLQDTGGLFENGTDYL